MRLLLDRVQLGDLAQRLLRQRAAIGSVQIKKLAPDVSKAGQFDRALCKQGLLAGTVVDHQVVAPVVQEVARMDTAPGVLIIEDDNGRPFFPGAGAVCPQVGLADLAAAGIELAECAGAAARPAGRPAAAARRRYGRSSAPASSAKARHPGVP